MRKVAGAVPTFEYCLDVGTDPVNGGVGHQVGWGELANPQYLVAG